MVHVLGGYQTDFERNWKKEGKSFVALLKETINKGLDNVRVSNKLLRELNRDGRVQCFVGNFIGEKFLDQGHLGSFLSYANKAFDGIPSARYEAACASGSVALEAAISKIKSGDIDLAIVIGFELMKTVDSQKCGDYLGMAAFYETEGKDIDYPFPKLFGKLADEIIKKYDYKDETRFMNALAKISSVNYSNAKRNPNAQTRKWFMNYKHASIRGGDFNKLIGGRLAISDCSQVTDGACIVFLASDNFVKKERIKNSIVVKGYGHRNAPILFEDKIRESKSSKYILPWTRKAILDAYLSSGLTVDDIDCFETHDCFTSSEYMAISAFGICEPGLEYEAIEKGIIDFNGKKPINPSGGLIGCGHPVGASGVRMFLDCYKQVAGKAGSYQIKNAKNAMMLNIGGSATTNYVFIVGCE